MGMKVLFEKHKGPMSMLLVQLLTTGVFLLSKVVLNKGAFIFSLLTYHLVFAAIFLVPFAYFIEGNMARKLSWMAVVWIFFNALFGMTMAMSLYYYGLRDTSASFATNFFNLVPVTNFVVSVVLRIEKLGLGSKGGRVKIVGTILCVAGALTITFYKGKPLHMWTSHVHNHQTSMKTRTSGEMVCGLFMLIGCCLSTAAWYITQAVFTTAANFCLISWAVAKRGPTYPSMFNPLSMIFVTILEAFFMGEEIFVGSIIGMTIIVGGLYAFLWGKRNEPPLSVRGGQRNQLSQPNVYIGDIPLVVESTQLNSAISPIVAPREGMASYTAREMEVAVLMHRI